MSDAALYAQQDRKLCEEISQRQKRLENIRKPFDLLYDDIDDYVTGRRSDYDLGTTRGRDSTGKQGSKIFDLTAAIALQDFVDGYLGNSASPNINWWSPIFRAKLLMKNKQARDWLDETKDAITTEINNSNFYSMLSEGVWDRATYGYSTIFGPEWSARDKTLIYYLRSPREVFFALSGEGNPDLWHRKFQITGRELLEQWPDASYSTTFRRSLQKDPYKTYTCIHATFPRDERDITKITAENKEYASIYMLDTEKLLLEESGMDRDEVPTCARWRIGGGAYPRSIAIDTIYATMTVNQMSRSVLRAAQLLVEPPLLIPGTMKGKVKVTPGGQSIKDSPQDTIEAIPFSSQLGAGLSEIGDTRTALGKMFKAEIFTLMSEMHSKVTAQQVIAMQGEKATLLQPIVTRDQNENLIPLIRKTFKVLQKAGRLPPPPPALMDPATRFTPVDIVFSGPVAMMAKRYIGMQGFNSTVPMVLEMAEKYPQLASMTDNIDPDQTYRYIMDNGGGPSVVSRDEKVVAQIRQARQQQMQQQQKLDAADKLAGAYQKGKDAPEKGSPSEQLMGGQE
jgi:Bacteriophage head to tail connecting protein